MFHTLPSLSRLHCLLGGGRGVTIYVFKKDSDFPTSFQQLNDNPVHSSTITYRIFWTIRRTPQILEENGGASYSLNVYPPYPACWGEGWGSGSGTGSQEAGAGPHFLLQIFFSYFSPLKLRCILWSGVSYSLKNTVLYSVFYYTPKFHPSMVHLGAPVNNMDSEP